ncbi:MAG: cell division protein ZapD [Neisseria sp.]|nr:cell division protein ZapD [Neisseria sp.]
MIRFEHPLSERVRNFMRIDYLFQRFQTETNCADTATAHHLALFTLFEIMECASRAELKLDILQELERQKQAVAKGGQEKAVLLDEIKQVVADLQNVRQKFGQHLRENEWLMSIKQRMLVPGGTSPFDLPSYYYWCNLPFNRRKADLQNWVGALMPTYRATALLLRILHHNAQTLHCEAEGGNYQYPCLAQNIHLLSIDVDEGLEVMPEVSANKYFTHIRFLSVSTDKMRGKQSERNIPFKMVTYSFEPALP